MLHSFHAFCNHLAFEGSSKPDNALQDGQVIRVDEHIAHKTLVNLEQRHAQTLKVRERRVARAKIIQRKLHTHLVTVLDDLRHLRYIFQRTGFEHFNLQTGRADFGMSFQDGLQAPHKVFLLQLPCANIDAHSEVQTNSVPGLNLRQCRVNHPFTHFYRQRVVFNHRQKCVGSKQTFVRMLPADKRFGPNDLAAAHVDFGLEVQHIFILQQRQADAFKAVMMTTQVAVVISIEYVIAVLARQLGLVHGLIRLTQELICPYILGLRVERYPKAG